MDVDPMPSSPTNSSPSSSDLDTDSTGTFFPDRSTTLGTLMGVTFPSEQPIRPLRVPSRRERNGSGSAAAAAAAGYAKPARRRCRRGRSWWMLCCDNAGPTSLGEFLKVERRDAGADVADGSFFFGGGGGGGEHVAVGGGPLFENGRVLPPPPPEPAAVERRRRERVPLLLAGICTGVGRAICCKS